MKQSLRSITNRLSCMHEGMGLMQSGEKLVTKRQIPSIMFAPVGTQLCLAARENSSCGCHPLRVTGGPCSLQLATTASQSTRWLCSCNQFEGGSAFLEPG